MTDVLRGKALRGKTHVRPVNADYFNDWEDARRFYVDHCGGFRVNHDFTKWLMARPNKRDMHYRRLGLVPDCHERRYHTYPTAEAVTEAWVDLADKPNLYSWMFEKEDARGIR